MKKIILLIQAFVLLSATTFGQAKLAQDSTAGANLRTSPSLSWSRNLLYGKQLYYMFDAKTGKTLPFYSAQLANYIFLSKQEAAGIYQPLGNYAPATGSNSYVPYIGATNDLFMAGHNATIGGNVLAISMSINAGALQRTGEYWTSNHQLLKIGSTATFVYQAGTGGGAIGMVNNLYFDGLNWKYIVAGTGSYLISSPTGWNLVQYPTGTAGSTALSPQTISFFNDGTVQAFKFYTLYQGRVGIGGGALDLGISNTDPFSSFSPTGVYIYSIPGFANVNGFRIKNGSQNTNFAQNGWNTDVRFPMTANRNINFQDKSYTVAGTNDNISEFNNDAGFQTQTAADARYPVLAGNYSNPSWITSLPYSKISGTPTFGTLATKNNGDLLASSITGNAATASNSSQLNGQPASYYSNYANLTGRPTNVSQFTNDAAYQTQSVADARYPLLGGAYANPSWITSLAYSKLTGTPTLGTLAAKNDGDLLSSSTTGNAATATNSANLGGNPSSYFAPIASPHFTGSVGICNTSPSYTLDVSGAIRATGDITANSDSTLKKNLVPINNALSSINKLHGYYFNWKDNGKKSIGLIAQEVEKVYPELVNKDKDGIMSVDYMKMVAPLIQAVNEQSRRINILENQVKYLKHTQHIKPVK